ncbi:MAG: ABC transporter ATP-binding protein [Candidatus Fermentibacteraceae bacterium]
MPPHGPGSGGGYFQSDDYEGKVYDARLVRRLLRYVRAHRKLVMLAILFMVLSTGVELAIPYLTKEGIDRYLARLYQVYTAPPAVSDSLLEADPEGRDFRAGAGDRLLVRKAALDDMGPARRISLLEAGELDRTTYYLFPAEEYEEGESPGRIMGELWLVPERKLSEVSPETIVKIRGSDLEGITRLALLAGLLILLSLGAGYGHVLTLQIAGQRSMYDLRMALFTHIQRLSLSFFDRNPIGRLVTRVANDIEALNEMFTAVLVNVLKDVFLLAGTIVILFAMDVRLALISLAVVPVFAFVSVVFRVKVRGVYRDVRKYLASLNSRLAEDVSGIKVIKIFRRERARRERYSETNERYFDANLRQIILFGVFRPMIEVVAAIGIALVLVFGGRGVLSGSLTLGVLVAFISYVRQMFRPISDISQKYNIMQRAMSSAERVFKIMDTEEEVRETDSPAVPERIEGRVEFRDVSFAYEPDKPVLKEVSFTVEPGRSVALVGPTGAGKTSIINILCRFYDVDSGEVLLDGIDLRDHSLSALRDNISIVLQDAFIFSRDVEDNIRLGEDIPMDRVMEAAGMVQADRFIERLPEGYEEMMSERGATLSTGQKQLICFARALAHDPKVLILDEATSSVDTATEQLIQNAIETLMRGRTSIVVAHRLSTIQNADEILVIDGGRIVERGNHQELLARRGIYYNLYLLQYQQ